MAKIDMSTEKDNSINLEAEMEKYLGGDDEVLAGFLESDEEPNFDTLNATAETRSIFQRITGALQSVTGNKQLQKEDMDPILRNFA